MESQKRPCGRVLEARMTASARRPGNSRRNARSASGERKRTVSSTRSGPIRRSSTRTRHLRAQCGSSRASVARLRARSSAHDPRARELLRTRRSGWRRERGRASLRRPRRTEPPYSEGKFLGKAIEGFRICQKNGWGNGIYCLPPTYIMRVRRVNS